MDQMENTGNLNAVKEAEEEDESRELPEVAYLDATPELSDINKQTANSQNTASDNRKTSSN